MAGESGQDSPIPQGNKRLVIRNQPANILDTKMNRRRVMTRGTKALLVGTAVAGAIVEEATVGLGRNLVSSTIEALKNAQVTTEEQKRATKLLEEAGELEVIRGLQAKEFTDEKGNKFGIMMRKRPADKSGRDPATGVEYHLGDELVRLKPGTTVDGIRVSGNEPYSNDLRLISPWVAFRNPQNPDQVVFAHSSGFEPDSRIKDIKQFDVWTK